MEPTRKLDPIQEHNTYSNYTAAGGHYSLISSSSSSNHGTQLQQYPESPNHYYYGHPHTSNKETMFEKPLTPSDVGKLNRLVIPKQHAEKYFPLNPTNNSITTTTTTADDPSPSSSPSPSQSSSSAAAGTLLSFEDESGKCWRFRYSYWNSSQSYVLTKGWSRYVKEKRLDAGDVVFFERHVGYPDRLFIGWRRRSNSSSSVSAVQDGSRVGGGGGYCYAGVQILSGYNSQPQLQQQDGSSLQSQGVGFCTLLPPSHPSSLYQRDRFHAAAAAAGGGTAAAMQTQRRPNANNNNDNPKRLLRLFGVNMECEPEEIHFLNNNNNNNNRNGHQTTSSSEVEVEVEEGSSSFCGRRTQFQQQGPAAVASSSQLNNAVVYFDYPNYDHYNNQHQLSSDDDVNLPPQSVNYYQLRHHPPG